MVTKITTPIPRDKIEECFVWRDWFQKLSDRVFGTMGYQDANSVNIVGGTINNTTIGATTASTGKFTDLYADTLAVDTGTNGQILVGRTSDNHFVPATLGTGTGISITPGAGSLSIANSGVTSLIAGTGITVSGATGAVTVSQSSTTIKAYGAYHDTSTTTATSATTAYVMSIGSVDLENGVSIVSGTKLTVTNAGIYNLQFSAQLSNPNSAIADVSIWIKKNGTNVTDGAGTNGVPGKHGGNNGLQIVSWNWVLSLAAADYIELYWHSDSTGVQLITIPATTSPAVPQSPALIVTLVQV